MALKSYYVIKLDIVADKWDEFTIVRENHVYEEHGLYPWKNSIKIADEISSFVKQEEDS